MASDRSLATLLRALQKPSGAQDAARLLDTAASLLTLLSNPLNISLLVSQTLTAPAVWTGRDELRTAARLLSLFNSACAYVRQERQSPKAVHSESTIGLQDWVTAVVKGADEKSPRWRHTLVLGGVIGGLGAPEEHSVPRRLESNLRLGFAEATNLAFEESSQTPEASQAICLSLAHVFDLLSDYEKSLLDHARLLPVLTDTLYFSANGMNWVYFLGAMDMDIRQGGNNKFDWSARSATFYQIQRLASSPAIQSFGVLSRIASLSIGLVADPGLFLDTVEALLVFSRSVNVQWQQNKLSEVDVSEQSDFLSQDTLTKTLAVMWQLLKSALFSVVILQSAIISRLLSDRRLPQSEAPLIATKVLNCLRNLYFVTTRLGLASFSQHTFVYLSSIDILSAFPQQSLAFLQSIAPAAPSTPSGVSKSSVGIKHAIPTDPHSRLNDLFFLNTAEHFSLVISGAESSLILDAAAPYISATPPDPRLTDLFEAAHSATLSVLAAPRNSDLARSTIPAYFSTLMHSFPASLSPRQLRLAVRTLVRVASSPGPILLQDPLLAPTLMQVVLARAEHASETGLPTLPHHLQVESAPQGEEGGLDALEGLSEKAALVLALVEALPVMETTQLEEWLSLVAEGVQGIADKRQRGRARHEFVRVLSAEMDVPRALVCVGWWTTRGGRELTLGQRALMSGALREEARI